MVPCKSTAEEVSFESSFHGILSTDKKLEQHYKSSSLYNKTHKEIKQLK